ncbi:unnamed protein product [Cylindrotheca closterium]|uniref:MIR domain-containing protein n=1 Tax=Cylindrotheca closterium TaxID=2856 RepID=A0AAD2FR41_9STRA|nr:unnamed protein product [Cylindrotheca closterium]
MVRFSALLVATLCLFTVTFADDDEEFVTCGSAVKLSHYESKAQTRQEHFLNSEGKNLGSGSGQQIVTAVTSPTTTNALWWIRGPNDPESRFNEILACKSGKPAETIQCGSILRLTHLNSLRNLHSHDVRSPLSRQQEVSGYGQGDGVGDNGDDWKLICNSGHWKRGEMFQLLHVDSKRYLGASSTVKFTHQNCGHNCPILNHLEVFGRAQKDNYANWLASCLIYAIVRIQQQVSHSFGCAAFNNCYKDDDEEFVTCGSAVKLSHYESKAQTKKEHFLSSETGKQLGSGSGQQIVTAVANPTVTTALWWIRGPNDPESRGNEIVACKSGKPAEKIQCGSILRLTHLNSLRNLHSHDVRSPLSRQQEVSGYGEGDGMGDNGDDWKLICNSGHWKREEMFQLLHVDSKRYLGASSTVKFTHQNCGHSCPILNHLEVFGRAQKDNYSNWFVEMGVHLSS